MTTPTAQRGDERHVEPEAATAVVPDQPDQADQADRPIRGTVGRVARIALLTVLGLLLMREVMEDLQSLRLRTYRAVSHWWSDVERRSRRDTRRAEIGLLASWIGVRRN